MFVSMWSGGVVYNFVVEMNILRGNFNTEVQKGCHRNKGTARRLI